MTTGVWYAAVVGAVAERLQKLRAHKRIRIVELRCVLTLVVVFDHLHQLRFLFVRERAFADSVFVVRLLTYPAHLRRFHVPCCHV